MAARCCRHFPFLQRRYQYLVFLLPISIIHMPGYILPPLVFFITVYFKSVPSSLSSAAIYLLFHTSPFTLIFAMRLYSVRPVSGLNFLLLVITFYLSVLINFACVGGSLS